MDKNTVIGILLIGAIFVVYMIMSGPSRKEIEEAQRRQDSIAQAEKEKALEKAQYEAQAENAKPVLSTTDSVVTETDTGTDSITSDSIRTTQLNNRYGSFSNAAEGKKEFITLENNLIRAKISTLGGRLYSVELKEYKTHDSLPLILFDGDSTVFGLTFHEQKDLSLFEIPTNNLFFIPQTKERHLQVTENAKSADLRLYAGKDRYLEYSYTLEPNSYLLKYNIRLHGLNQVFAPNQNVLALNWEIAVPSQEKGQVFENNYTTIHYKYLNDEEDYLLETSDSKEEELRTKVRWISFKQQFFTSVLIADDHFLNGYVKYQKILNSDKYLKYFFAELSIPYDNTPDEDLAFSFFFGPNKYSTLRKYGKIDGENVLQLERQITLGWSFFLMQWINRYAVIPVFNFLEKFISSYGLIILILTILLKIVLFPLTFRSYLSTAKMRVLKPQIDEIHKKIPKEKNMERQQATMALYKKVGVNPMGGCLPMLVQFPILIAMFRFFPSSIELRQKSFLWADDLSSYDSIIDLPFEIPMYGDHISLFCLLMAITNIFYTRMNSAQMSTGTQMPGMKTMMYLMPVMFLVFFNNYSSGLSYYYFISTLITIGQTLIIRRMVNDEEILHKLETAKKKPKKKSGFQARLEKMAKERGYKAPKK